MKILYSDTLGKIPAPTENDIDRAFSDSEWGDVAGNIFTLEDGLEKISSVSEVHKEYSLGFYNGLDWRELKKTISIEEVLEYFKRFLRGEKEWINQLEWKVTPKTRWVYRLAYYFIIVVIVLSFILYHLKEIVNILTNKI